MTELKTRTQHPVWFLDTSALAKLYLNEPGSRELKEWVCRRTQGFETPVRLCVSLLGYPEAMSAVSKQRNGGGIAPSTANRLLIQVSNDFFRAKTPFEIVDPSEVIVGRAALLVPTHNLRSFDAVQLATALHLHLHRGLYQSPTASLLFVSSDRKLNNVARAEGLSVADPATPEGLKQLRS